MNVKDICAFLTAERAFDRVALTAKIALTQFNAKTDCPRYLAALKKALREESPIFSREVYSDIYRGAAQNGEWMAISLMSNAEREGDGATRLWSLAACSEDANEQRLLKRHAVDESSHALAYLALLDRAFPGAVSATFRTQLRQLSPSYSMGQKLAPVADSPYARTPSVDDYVQMNIAEIRTALHHIMQRVALVKHCPGPNLPQLVKILDGLLLDELRHVAYTGVLIESKSRGEPQKELNYLFCKRVYDFNKITHEELGQSEIVFD